MSSFRKYSVPANDSTDRALFNFFYLVHRELNSRTNEKIPHIIIKQVNLHQNLSQISGNQENDRQKDC